MIVFDGSNNKIMSTYNPKKASTTTISHTEALNYGEALRLLKNTDAMIDRKKKQLRVKAMKAQRGSWIAGV